MHRILIVATLLLLLLLNACTSGARPELPDAESPSSRSPSPLEPTGTIEEQSTPLPTATVEASATPRVVPTETAAMETPAATPTSNSVDETVTLEEPVVVETTEDLTAIEILNRRSSKFSFFSDREEIPSEEIFLEVRRVDETWRDPLVGEPFPYYEEYKGFATLNGDVGKEHLRNYVMGMLRLNLVHHGYTEFADSDYFEFIANYDQAVENDTPMPPLTIHGIDSVTGEYAIVEVPLEGFVITHYVEVGYVWSFDKLNTSQVSEDSPELPLFYKTGSTNIEIAHGIIVDRENNQVFAVTRVPPIVENYFKSYLVQDTFMRVFKLLALPPHIQESIHTAHTDNPNLNGMNLGQFVNEGVSNLPETVYGEVYRAERVYALEEHPITE